MCTSVVYKEALIAIQEYLDSPSVNIDLTEYSNLSKIIKAALEELDENSQGCEEDQEGVVRS